MSIQKYCPYRQEFVTVGPGQSVEEVLSEGQKAQFEALQKKGEENLEKANEAVKKQVEKEEAAKETATEQSTEE